MFADCEDEDDIRGPHTGVQNISGFNQSTNSRNVHIRGSHSEKPNARQRNTLHDGPSEKSQGYQGEELKERKYSIRESYNFIRLDHNENYRESDSRINKFKENEGIARQSECSSNKAADIAFFLTNEAIQSNDTPL